jgi:hypothetical protein
MRDLIIGGCYNYNYDQIKYWINSVNRSGFVGDKVLIVYDCTDELAAQIEKNNFKVVRQPFNPDMAPHVQRFVSIYQYLADNPARYVITTDVRDVVFQKNPVDWLNLYLGNKAVAVASECLRYKDEPWGDNNIKETFGDYIYNIMKDNVIYNVGVIGGLGEYVRDICLDIAVHTINRPIKICDQSVFNFLIMNKMYKDKMYFANLQNNWVANLGTLADPHKMHYFRPNLLEPEPAFDGKFITGYGGVPVIAHQYDRTIWKSQIENIYQ